MKSIYYVYAYFCEEQSIIYYVGKGKGDRAYSLQHGAVPVPKDPKNILFIKENVSEEEAFACEILMIQLWGREDQGKGTLLNRTDGGQGSSGAVRSPEFCSKVSDLNKERNSAASMREGYFSYINDAALKSATYNKISQKNRNRRWCNNGQEEMKVHELPEGYTWGRRDGVKYNREANHKRGKRGAKWCNNGVKEIKAYPESLLEGYTWGRLSNSFKN